MFEINCCVRGYHVYHRLWTATVGENLTCTREHTNESNRYAVAKMKVLLDTFLEKCLVCVHCFFEEEVVLLV